MTVKLPSDKSRELERASAPQRALAEAVDAGKVSMSAILKAVGINPNDATHQAALLACERYELDPLLKHIVVIPGAGPYITRDGWLHIAHRVGTFDGMEVVETGEDANYWTAKVAVYRKDMGRPFAYVGRYPKAGSNKKYGPEMAIKTAEVAALRRAFPVSGVGAYEERWEDDTPDVERFTPTVETHADVVDQLGVYLDLHDDLVGGVA
jgi:hypothetical protein